MSCGGEPTSVFLYTQALGGVFSPNLPYILSAPLDTVGTFGGSPSAPFLTQSATLAVEPAGGRTKKLVLLGAPAFRITVDASIVAGLNSSQAYVSAGIGLNDVLIETAYGSTFAALPPGTIRFNYADVDFSDFSVTGDGVSASSFTALRTGVTTSVSAVVPPGTYYVSGVAITQQPQESVVVGTLDIAAVPLVGTSITSIAQVPAVTSSQNWSIMTAH